MNITSSVRSKQYTRLHDVCKLTGVEVTKPEPLITEQLITPAGMRSILRIGSEANIYKG